MDLNYTSMEPFERYDHSIEKATAFEILSAFNEISVIVNRGQDLKKTLAAVLDKVLEMTKMEKGGVYLKEKKTGDFVLTVHSDVSKRFLKIHERITREWKTFLPLMDEGKVYVVEDSNKALANADPARLKSVRVEGFRSYIGIPLINGDSVDGIMMVSSLEPHEFTEVQVRLFSVIGQQIGVSIKNCKLIEQLRKTRETYFDLFHNAKDMIYIHDLGGNFLFVNKAALDTLQCSRKELLKSNIRDFLAEESFEVFSFLLPCICSGEQFSYPFIFEVIRKDGKSLFIEFNLRPVIKEGKTIGIHGIARDVDKRFHAEKNMLVFSKAINFASDGINISDAEHKITFTNQAGANIFGYSRAELIGQSCEILYAEEDLPNLEENVIPALEKYGYWNGLVLGRKKDGTAFPIEIALSSVNDDNGKPLINICVFRERKTKKLHIEDHDKHLL